MPRADLTRALKRTQDVVRDDRRRRAAWSATRDVAVLFVLGVGMRTHTGVARTMFGALAARGINIAMINTSEVCVGVVVEQTRGEEALACLQGGVQARLSRYPSRLRLASGIVPVTERCRSGRSGRSRKPLTGKPVRGFESLPLRCPVGPCGTSACRTGLCLSECLSDLPVCGSFCGILWREGSLRMACPAPTRSASAR